MISLIEISAAAKEFRVPAETIEKDYVISWVLACLSGSLLRNDFVFYGGTAIKRIYFSDHRFSEDVDLVSKNKFTVNQLIKNLTLSFEFARARANLLLQVEQDRILTAENRIQIFVRYSGYHEILGSPKEIRLDFAMEMDPVGESESKKIGVSYSDLKELKGKLKVQSLNTILAIKLGLLTEVSRTEPRDIFDIWFLLNRTQDFSFDIKKIKKFFKERVCFLPSLEVLRPHLANPLYKERWERRLKSQVADLPSIDIILKDIDDKLKIYLP